MYQFCFKVRKILILGVIGGMGKGGEYENKFLKNWKSRNWRKTWVRGCQTAILGAKFGKFSIIKKEIFWQFLQEKGFSAKFSPVYLNFCWKISNFRFVNKFEENLTIFNPKNLMGYFENGSSQFLLFEQFLF